MSRSFLQSNQINTSESGRHMAAVLFRSAPLDGKVQESDESYNMGFLRLQCASESLRELVKRQIQI